MVWCTMSYRTELFAGQKLGTSTASGQGTNMDRSSSTKNTWLIMGVLLALGTGVLATLGDEPPKAGEKKPMPMEEKRYEITFSGKPWKFVFEWVTDTTKLPFVGKEKPPAGTFNVTTPKGHTYSVNEILDLINEALAEQKFLVVRRANSFTLLVSDTPKLPPELIPRISIAELEKR